MYRLQQLPLRRQVFLVMLLPMLLLLGLGFFEVMGQYRRLGTLQQAGEVVRLAEHVQRVRLYLQRERGFSLAHLASGEDHLFAPRLLTARNQVKGALGELQSVLTGDHRSPTVHVASDNLRSKVEMHRAVLNEARYSIDEKAISQEEVLTLFGDFLSVMSSYGSLETLTYLEGATLLELRSVDILSSLQDVLGVSRAIWTAAVIRGSLSDTDYLTLSELEAVSNALIGQFYQMALPAHMDYLRDVLDDSDIVSVDHLFVLGDMGNNDVALAGQRSDAFRLLSIKIDRIDGVAKRIQQELSEKLSARRAGTATKLWGGMLLVVSLLGMVIILSRMVLKSLTSSIEHLATVTEHLTKGESAGEIPVTRGDEVGKLQENFRYMVDALQASERQLREQQWLKDGLATLSARLQGASDSQKIGEYAVSLLAKNLEAHQGALFVREADRWVLCGSYAYHYRKGSNQGFCAEGGLLDQCASENTHMIVQNLPEDYLSIRSGLGSSVPKELALFPVAHEGEVLAILEFASLRCFTEQEIKLARSCAEALAVTLRRVQETTRIRELLSETEAQAASLQKANDELNHNNAALESSQSKIADQNRELEALSRKLDFKARRLATSNHYKSEFLANMSHELRTPLNSMLLLAKLLRDNPEGNLSVDQTESADIIYTSGQSLLQLINDILDLSKVEAGKLEVKPEQIHLVKLVDELRRTFTVVSEDKGLSFSIESKIQDDLIIETDRLRLEQILRNLLSNAFKFTENGGVQLEVEAVTTADYEVIRSPALRTPNTVAIRVTDSGIGISEDKRAEVFEPFVQGDGTLSREYAGTGLGLAVSQRLATLLGVELACKSTPDVGSVFTVYLSPDWKGTAPMSQGDVPLEITQRESSADDKRVLLVENDDSTVQAVSRILKRYPLQLTLASNLATAREQLAEGKFDLLILDLGLPDGPGIDLLHEASERYSLPRVIVLTGKDLERNQYLELRKYTDSVILKADEAPTRLESEIISALDLESDAPIENIQAGPEKAEVHQLLCDRLQKGQVLVVDDDLRNSFAIASSYSKYGVSVLVADNGELALERLYGSDEIRAVVLDLMMPNLDGLEVIRRIRSEEILVDMPIIVLSARTSAEQRAEALTLGANCYLHKPIELEDLSRALLSEITQPDSVSQNEPIP